MADQDTPCVTNKPKKRRSSGRKKDQLKKVRLSSHQTGEDCKCKRFKCFEATTREERDRLITAFNELHNKDDQDAFLSTLIGVLNVARRRPKTDGTDPKPKDKSYSYKIKVQRDDKVEEVDICVKGFIAVFGISHKRVRTIQTALKETGFPPKDKRGKHSNHVRKLTADMRELVIAHIGSFKGRSSHYSRKKSSRLYLPETLNITKMFNLFCEQHPGVTLSYESYRTIFNENFNISFGYPRSDTCSTCDEFQAKISSIDSQLLARSDETDLQAQKAKLSAEKELHQRKAEIFYERKRAAKNAGKQDKKSLAIAFDFQKELPVPNKTTNDVFYRRQLSLHSFNIHDLAGDNVYIYTYDETVGKRGSDDVASILHHFIKHSVPQDVRNIEMFCDGCAGQNKNWTVFRFLYALVHFWKRFDKVKVSFPIRGHSYMECDRDLSLVNKTNPIDVPDQWVEEFRSARVRPSPYNVIIMDQESFFKVAAYLKPLFKPTCPAPTRPIREVVFSIDHPMLMQFRNNWHGNYESAVVSPRRKTLPANIETVLKSDMERKYLQPLPISLAKFEDLQVLKRFCDPRHHAFFDNLSHDSSMPNNLHEEQSDSEEES